MIQKITTENASNVFDGIESYSTPGKNNILSKFVKFTKRSLFHLLILAKLFNRCIDQNIFPLDFETAYVVPIPKTLSPKSLYEFCFISLLSVFYELFEKILEKNIKV